MTSCRSSRRRATWCACLLWLILGSLLPTVVTAGVLAGATRVVYREGEHERSLMLANTNSYPVLVQAWIDDGGGSPDNTQAPFVVLPAVFRLQPGALQGLRLLYNGDPLPRDRESVFWLNLYEIPGASASDNHDARLLLAMNTQLKIFYRPRALPMAPETIADHLTFSLVRDGDLVQVVCHNPTPYHASFANLALVVDGQSYAVDQQPDMMARPFESHSYPMAAPPQSKATPHVRFSLLDDAGNPHEHDAPLGEP